MSIRRRLEVVIVVFVVIVLMSKMYLYITTNTNMGQLQRTDALSQMGATEVKKPVVGKINLDNEKTKLPEERRDNKSQTPIVNIENTKAQIPTVAPHDVGNLSFTSKLKVVLPDPQLINLQNVVASRRIQSLLHASMVDESSHNILVKNIYNFVKNVKSRTKPLCGDVPPDLIGFKNANFTASHSVTMADVEKAHPDVDLGGSWGPPNCTARSRVAIIIPFRDRYHHLEILLHHMIPVWKRQQIGFGIFVVEQYGLDSFNKGRVMNAGFLEASKIADFQCFVFHDVDMVLVNDRNMYTCPDMPRHMSVMVDELGYEYPVYGMVGGVFSIQTDHYRLVNGYSNRYWGWGAEDDDMGLRIQNRGLRIQRPPSFIAQYRMIPHQKRHSINERKMYRNLRNQRGFIHDGINSVHYKIVHDQQHALYTHFVLDITD